MLYTFIFPRITRTRRATPLLIRYDLRIYVLLTSLQPLRLFLFRDGLVRICTEKYELRGSSLGSLCMHLTNYSINKDHDTFTQPSSEADDSSHKRLVSTLLEGLAEDGVDVDTLWSSVEKLCVKTILSVQPHLLHTYATCRGRAEDAGSACFELLGFDVLIDYKMRPYLIEVRCSRDVLPSRWHRTASSASPIMPRR